MTATGIEGLVWLSLVYQSTDPMDGLTGPDANTRCESPRHRFGSARPLAGWIEMLWFPHSDRRVSRCWKTCEDCHVEMAKSAEEGDT